MLNTLMSWILIIGMILTGTSLLLLLLDQHETMMREFAVLGLFCAELTLLSYYCELNTPGIAAKIDAVKFGYIGKVFVNPMLVMLAVKYYNIKVKRILQMLMYLVPILTLYLVFTCESSNLYYKKIELLSNGLLSIEPGPAYYAYIAYNMLLALLYLSLCLYQRAGLHGHDKENNSILLLASLVPFFTLMVYLSGWTQGYDVSTVGVMIGSMLVTLSIFRYGLLNKDEMLQNMATGLIFLDSEDYLIYANNAAEQIIPALTSQEVHTRQISLRQLCDDNFATIQVDTVTYQRKITEWSNGDGQHGKLITFDDITEIRARLNRDEMTGLYNHATFYPMLETAMEKANLSRTTATVAIADIDSFKYVNDTYGHANGDTVLIALAETLQRVCEGSGDVFRYGGEEFAVIFRGDYQLAEQTMQQALDEFSALEFDFLPYHVTFSFGSAEFNGTETSVALFDRADQKMYTRKKALHEQERAAGIDRSRHASEPTGTVLHSS